MKKRLKILYEFKIRLIKNVFNDWDLFYLIKTEKKKISFSNYVLFMTSYYYFILILFSQVLTLLLFFLFSILGVSLFLLIKNTYSEIYKKSKLKKLYNEGYHISIFTIPDHIPVAFLGECYFLTYDDAIKKAINFVEELNSYSLYD